MIHICQLCHDEYRTITRWRPVVDDHYNPRFAPNGHLLLEEFQRELCRCSSKPFYVPLPGVNPPQQEPPYHIKRHLKEPPKVYLP